MPEMYWNSSLQTIASPIIAELMRDPDRNDPIWSSIDSSSKCLSDFLGQFDEAGHSLDDLRVLQGMLLDTDGDETLMPFVVYNILPRLQATRARVQSLETTVDLISRKFSAFAKDVFEALPEYHGYVLPSTSQTQLNRLSAAFRKHKDTMCYNNDKDEPDLVSRSDSASGRIGKDDDHKRLVERVRVLEEMVAQDRNQREFRRSITTAEESCAADAQQPEHTMQAHQPAFAALSDASESSICTLTPASVSRTKQTVTLSRLTTGRP